MVFIQSSGQLETTTLVPRAEAKSVGADLARKSDSINRQMGLMIVMDIVVNAIVLGRKLNQDVWVGGSNRRKNFRVYGEVPTDVEISANASTSELSRSSSQTNQKSVISTPVIHAPLELGRPACHPLPGYNKFSVVLL